MKERPFLYSLFYDLKAVVVNISTRFVTIVFLNLIKLPPFLENLIVLILISGHLCDTDGVTSPTPQTFLKI